MPRTIRLFRRGLYRLISTQLYRMLDNPLSMATNLMVPRSRRTNNIIEELLYYSKREKE